jgi:hypothetical protein
MALLATQVATGAGIGPAFAAASAGGDTMAVGEDVALYVKNASGAPVTVTIASPGVCNQGGNHPLVVSVPAAGERLIGPLTPAYRFGDPVTGLVSITYSSATSVTVAAIKA